MIRFSLTRLFTAAVAVGAAHYGITGLESAVASGFVAMYAGWGALAYDIVQRGSDHSSGRADKDQRVGSSGQAQPHPSR
jgi:hypothetical protein